MANVDRFAAALYALGVRKGDRVALMLPNLPQFVIAFFGALKLGAIVVNTNPTYTAREIEHQFADSGCETVVLLSAFYDKLKEVQDHTQVKRVIIADVPDYVPAPGNALVKRTLKKHGQMVDVTLGNGVYSFKKLIDQHPEAPPQRRDRAARCRAVPVHGRHHGRAQGGHVDALQPGRQYDPGQELDEEPGGGQRAHDGRHPLLPCVRHDGRDAARRPTWLPS